MCKKIRARLRGTLWLLTLVPLLAVVYRPAAGLQSEPQTPPNRFGVIESDEDPAAADRLGAGWTRVRFQWAEVQPDGPDQWLPPLTDDELADELAAGREVVGLLIGIPDWARDRQGVPRGLERPYDDPGNTWAAFVREAVGRYAGRIDRWIIWNEPDIDDPDAPGHTWDGDLDAFVQLQRVAYLTAKEANPDAAVHLAAFTYFWDPDYFDRFLAGLAADPNAAANDYYFDVATAHLYFQPDRVYSILTAFRAAMADHGLDKPIWLVETNAPPSDDPYWPVPNWTLAVSLGEQAAFIPQALASALAAGAERVAVYKLKDTEGDRAANPEPFGLMRWDNSRRPAYDTYRIAIRLMDGVVAAERERWDGVGQIRLEQADRTTTVLFARLPQPQAARVEALAAEAELVDMWGQRETVAAEDGYFEVELPAALCLQTIADYCMIGSTTYYLIQERDEAAARAQATARALAATATPRPTTTPTVTPSPTPSATTTPSPTPSSTPAPTLPPPTPSPVPAQATATPLAAGVADGPNGGAAGPAGDYTGLVVIGVGLLLGLGLVGWRLWGAPAGSIKKRAR